MLFYLASFIYIFLLFNREFVPYIDLRYVNFLFFIILLLNKIFYFLKYKSLSIVGNKASVCGFIGLIAIIIISNIGWFSNPFEPDRTILLDMIVLYIYNFIAVIVFSLYWQRYDIKLFKYFFLVSGTILCLSIVMQFLGVESLPFQGEVRTGKEEDEAIIFGLRYGGYAEDQNYATISMVIWIYTGFAFFKNSVMKYLIFGAGVIGILLSFSKTIIIIIILLIFYAISKYLKLQFVYIISLLLTIGIVFGILIDFLMSLSTVYIRINMWYAAFLGFLESPIIGNGISSVRSNFLYRGGWYVQPHNSFIAILVDHGILGFILYVFLLIEAFRNDDILYKYLLIVFIVFSLTYELFVFQYPYFIVGILPMMINQKNGKLKFINFKLNKTNENLFSS